MSAGTFPSTVAPSLWCYLLATGAPSSESLGHAISALFEGSPKAQKLPEQKNDEGSQVSNQNCWLQSADVTRGFTGFHSGLTSARYSAEASSWR